MTTYNTGNPIGSTDARDRYDNSENLDLAVNSLSQTFIDRLGVTRDTLEGVYQKSAYYRAGTFDAGYTLTNNRQTLAYGNVEYSWSGAFPKVVAAGSTPATSGGIGVGAWVDRTQDTFKSELELNLLEQRYQARYALADFISISDFIDDTDVSDSESFQRAVDYALASGEWREIFSPSKQLTFHKPVVLDAGPSNQQLKLSLVGSNTEVLVSTITTAGVLTRLQPARVAGAPGTDIDDYDVAAAFVVVAPNSTNIRNFRIDGFNFGATGTAIGKQVMGIFAPRIALSSFKNLRFSDLSEGIHCRNMFLCDFQNVDFRDSTWGLRHNRTAGDFGGTSCSFDRVSIASCTHGWELDNLVYSSMSACSVEDWAAGNYGFKAINRSSLDVNIGMEAGNGPGLWIEGAANTSYANATIGGRTVINFKSSNNSLGKSSVTNITDFGISGVDKFSVIKRDASLTFDGNLWNQEYNGTTKIQVSLEFDSASRLLTPTVDVYDNVDFGLTHSNFIVTGSGTKRGVARVRKDGVWHFGVNSSIPPTDNVAIRLAKSANQTFSSGTPANLTWAAPAVYFDRESWFNATLDGITIKSCGMYKAKVRLQVGAVAATDSLQVYIKHGGGTWGAAEFYGSNTTKQMIELEALVPVFAEGQDLTVQCARGASGVPVTVVGDTNFCQLSITRV